MLIAACLSALLSIAQADTPPPSYRAALVQREWTQVDALIEAGHYNQAIERAQRFEQQVCEDASLAYLIGLSFRLNAQPKQAQNALSRAVRLDPGRTDAWSDLGELLLLSHQLDLAERAFTQVSVQLTEGKNAWFGPFRLAEIAAYRRQPDAMAAHLREALRRGFSFTVIENDPHWAGFLQTPELSLTLESLLLNYAGPSSLNALKKNGTPP